MRFPMETPLTKIADIFKMKHDNFKKFIVSNINMLLIKRKKKKKGRIKIIRFYEIFFFF